MGIDQWRNPDGTYDGAQAMADLTGLSRDEILWTFNRLKELRAMGLSKAESKARVAEEVRGEPWKV